MAKCLLSQVPVTTCMPQFGRIQALLARVDTLKRHAIALEHAFLSEALKTQAKDLISTLRTAEDVLRRTPDAEAIRGVEDTLDAASRRLSGLGRV